VPNVKIKAVGMVICYTQNIDQDKKNGKEPKSLWRKGYLILYPSLDV